MIFNHAGAAEFFSHAGSIPAVVLKYQTSGWIILGFFLQKTGLEFTGD